MSTTTRLIRLLPPPVRDGLIRRRIERLDPKRLAGVRVELARTPEDLATAARIVHDAYVARGILSPHPSRMRLAPHFFLPTTVGIVARRDDRIIGTVSVVPDSPLGLPMDAIYRDRLDGLRAHRAVLGEVVWQGVERSERGTGVALLLNALLERAAYDALGITTLVAAIHPDAVPLYRAGLDFEPFGPERIYPGLNASARAVPIRMSIIRPDDDNPYPPEMWSPDMQRKHRLRMRAQPQLEDEAHAFGVTHVQARARRTLGAELLARYPAVWGAMTSAQRGHLRQLVPRYSTSVLDATHSAALVLSLAGRFQNTVFNAVA